MSEAKLKIEAREYMRSLPMLWYYATVPTGYGKRGVPDDLICYKGLFFAIEYKAHGKHPTHMQKEQIEEIYKAGGCVTIAWSMADVRALFEDGVGIIPDENVPGLYKKVKYH
jgi:Holliday junction resolvase